jgi:hypothetical protein
VTGLVYPRLGDGVGRPLIAELLEASAEGLDGVRALIRMAHPKAAHVATGGVQATEQDIEGVRASVLDAVGHWVDGRVLPRRDQALFDATLGKALHQALSIASADASHQETWTFLTLCVLPDVALTRFPTLPEPRGLGTQRNALRRVWIRYEVLGDILFTGTPMLGEDELVGLLERTAVARNRELVGQLATAVLAYEGAEARSEFARRLYKRVRHRTGPRMLDVLSAAQLEELVHMEAVGLGRLAT